MTDKTKEEDAAREKPPAKPAPKPLAKRLVRVVGLKVRPGLRAGLMITRQWQPFDLTAEQLKALAGDPQVRIKEG